jgi:hypothetical protein
LPTNDFSLKHCPKDDRSMFKFKRFQVLTGLGAWLLLVAGLSSISSFGAEPRHILSGQVPAAVAHLTPLGLLPATNQLYLAIGLPLRNEDELNQLLREIYDPTSTNYHRYLTPEQFTEQFGPTVADYEAVQRFAESNGFTVTGTHDSRMVLDVQASSADVENAFQVTLRTYRHPAENRNFFAPDVEPSVPTNLPVADVWGLSDYALPHPLSHFANPAQATPLTYNGSGANGSYRGADFRNAFAPGVGLTGLGQTVAVAEFDGYYAADISSYEAQSGYASVPLTNVYINVTGTPGYSGVANAVLEVSLDIEMAIAMAPRLSEVMVYEGSSPYDVFNQIASDNLAKQISCSWTWGAGPSTIWSGPGSTLDSLLKKNGHARAGVFPGVRGFGCLHWQPDAECFLRPDSGGQHLCHERRRHEFVHEHQRFSCGVVFGGRLELERHAAERGFRWRCQH